MTSLSYADSPIIESGAGGSPNATATLPRLLWVGQASGIVVATVVAPTLITTPITAYTLLRAPTATGPWTPIDVRAPSAQSRWTNLFDQPTATSSGPLYGSRAYYYATIDGGYATNALYFVAHRTPTPIVPGTALSAGAFGLYPLLGSDALLNPITGEGVIGPNGDLMAVNGLDCLAQDLRTRITTEQGELLLHPDFGMTRERLIGSGQSNPAAQAQALQARFIDVLTADKRVLSVQSLTIAKVSWDTWTIDVTLIAIGVEDPKRLNIVVPFYRQ